MKTVLHLVRGDAAPVFITETDWLVMLDPLELADRGTPPIPPGPIDHDQLIALIVAAHRVVTW